MAQLLGTLEFYEVDPAYAAYAARTLPNYTYRNPGLGYLAFICRR